jgi:predicted RNase H-like HicB family nuclease
MVAMKTYQVLAQRIDRGWILSVPEVRGAVSQIHSLTQAQDDAREAISLILDVPEDSFEIQIQPQLDQALLARIEHAREAVTEAEGAQRDAAQQSRAVVKALAEEVGLSGRDISAIMHISQQRVSQLLHT